MAAMRQLKKLGDLFMKNLEEGRLLELVIPRNSQLDLVGSIEIDDDEYDGDETLIRKSLISSETSKCYAQLMAIAGLLAEQLYCTEVINFEIMKNGRHLNFLIPIYANMIRRQDNVAKRRLLFTQASICDTNWMQ